MFGYNYSYTTVEFDDGFGNPNDKARHWSLIYNTFMFMTVFNMINCRKVGIKDYNVFDRFFHNWYFVITIVALIAIQVVSS